MIMAILVSMEVRSESSRLAENTEVSFVLEIAFHQTQYLFDKDLERTLKLMGGSGSTDQW